jgi:ABC-2 type transport system ATP-binding protein
MYGMSQPEADADIDRLAETFGLASFFDRLTESYSHGMKQRIAFASALLHHPAILMLDEPMVGLDPRTMRLVKDLLREEAEKGLTIFMSTHTLSVAEEVADRIGVIDKGRLLFLGTVDQLRQHLSAAESNLEELYLQLTDNGQSSEGENGVVVRQ